MRRILPVAHLGSRLLAVLFLPLVSCSEPSLDVPISQRLVDVYSPDWLDGASSATVTPPRKTEWRFDGAGSDGAGSDGAGGSDGAETGRWTAVSGTGKLTIRDGHLVGRATTEYSTLLIERTWGTDDDNPLEEVQIRMRASAGQRVSIHFVGRQPGDMSRAIEQDSKAPWPLSTEIEAGGEFKTYTLRNRQPLRSSDIQKLYLRPTDQSGARFEIESLRLVFRREVLAEKDSGVSWEGLSQVYRESVLARSPESIRWPVTLPSRPQLELTLGTLDARPLTFQVFYKDRHDVERLLVERTLTSANRWREVILDLDSLVDGDVLSGRDVTLRLALVAEDDGILGLWGSPVVRQRMEPGGVIFVLADTLRADRLQLYGHDRVTAPHLGQMAAEGALFVDAQSQATWTKVSVPSLLTSLYPLTHGVLDLPHRLPSSATTLAEVYRQAGYATLGFSSITFTGKHSNLHQGFEALHETAGLEQSKTARGFVDSLLPWIEKHQNQRFFVQLHVFDPHSPFEPKPPHNSAWADPAWHQEHRDQRETIKSFIADPLRQVPNLPNRDEVVEAGFDPETFIERDLAWYDGSIRGMDEEIGRLFERLAELGLAEETLVVVVSDHGEEFHEHGRMFHGQSVYGELTHVPLLLRYPGVVPPGTVIDQTVQLIDVMPTVLELSGLRVPAEAQGRSLVPLLLGDEEGWRPRPAISHQAPMIFKMVPPLASDESAALVFDGWKLVHHWRPLADTPEFELFDHRGDPLNLTDVAAEHPGVVERLAGLLDDWRQEAEAARLASDSETVGDMKKEELDRLRALGYVQ